MYRPKPSAHGFVPGRSITTNARQHLGQRIVFNLDLADFFHTIHIGRFMGVLQQPPFDFGLEAATTVAQICFGASGRLPQGAPSSPVVSNLVCRSLDDKLQNLAHRFGCRYTRYADDLTFSTSRPTMPLEIAEYEVATGRVELGSSLAEVIAGEGFLVNKRKIRLNGNDRRQEVTGLTVNEQPNTIRRFVREIDSILQCWRKHGVNVASNKLLIERRLAPATLERYPDFIIRVLQGKLAFLSMVKGRDDPLLRRLRWAVHDRNPEVLPPPPALKDHPASPLRGYIGRFRGWQRVVRPYLNSVKYVQVLVDGEVHAGASAYVIGPNVLVTAGHVPYAGALRIGFEKDGLIPSKICYANVKGGQDWALLFFAGCPFESHSPLRFQFRVPEVGEEIVALGFPRIPNRDTSLVVHSGTVEALPTGYHGDVFIQTSFQSGGGLSGGPVLDKRGYVLGLMIENVFMETDGVAPIRPYGQATPHEYVARARALLSEGRGEILIASGACIS